MSGLTGASSLVNKIDGRQLTRPQRGTATPEDG